MKRSGLPAIAGLLAFVFHLIANPHYGFFRDELYFIICGFHPQWGYVDQPPVTPLLAAGSQLFGHSLFVLRAVPAIFGGASIYVVCVLVLELGGGKFAAILAAIGATLSLVLASFAMKTGPDMVGLWLWPLVVLYVVRIIRGGDPRLWLAAGTAIGFGLESKYTTIFFLLALVLGLLLTPERIILRSKWFAAGVALAVVIALPNFIWQAVNGFPMLELLRAGQSGKNVALSPLMYLITQIIITNPLLALVWICGLIWCFFSPRLRFLGYGYVLLIVMMIATHAKHYYPADIYPALFATGGVAIAIWTQHSRFLRPVFAAAAVTAGLVLLPYVEPVLPEQTFIAYNKAVGPKIGESSMASERLKQNWMTQDWADMHGWPELAVAVQSVYDALPPLDRAQAVAVGQNYGEASAIEFFSSVPVISGHNQYYLWGTRGYSGNVVIDVGGDCGASSHLFRASIRAAMFTAPYVMPYEDHLPIMVCRGIAKPLQQIWPAVKHYI